MIYFLRCHNFIKIGFTDNDLIKRVSSIQIGNPYEIKLIGVIEGDSKREKLLHSKFIVYHVRGEWFFESRTLKNFIKNNVLSYDEYINNILEIELNAEKRRYTPGS